MRTVATFTNQGDAAIAQSVLEGAGIGVRCENVESSVNLSGGLPAIGIVVAEEDFAAADELLHPEPRLKTPVEPGPAQGWGQRALRRMAAWVAGR
ncbi:MAG: putative prokaryotic signal transducing protein [Verrucomicrobia bacterium]|nr:putative prokaryotic signal transducing protein [Verrucomicrobiota bacterium]